MKYLYKFARKIKQIIIMISMELMDDDSNRVELCFYNNKKRKHKSQENIDT